MQVKQLYVGNLDYSVTNELLEKLFKEFGKVLRVNVLKQRGFGFVDMLNADEANTAKLSLDGTVFYGRKIFVSDARTNPKNDSMKSGRKKVTRQHHTNNY